MLDLEIEEHTLSSRADDRCSCCLTSFLLPGEHWRAAGWQQRAEIRSSSPAAETARAPTRPVFEKLWEFAFAHDKPSPAVSGGGVDPLQALVDQTRPPVTEDDEPDSEFERGWTAPGPWGSYPRHEVSVALSWCGGWPCLGEFERAVAGRRPQHASPNGGLHHFCFNVELKVKNHQME